jgi:hypothetical protein
VITVRIPSLSRIGCRNDHYTPKAGDTTRASYVIDATDVVLGRLAAAAATLLRGKHKPTFTPIVDGGDFVITAHDVTVSELPALSPAPNRPGSSQRH